MPHPKEGGSSILVLGKTPKILLLLTQKLDDVLRTYAMPINQLAWCLEPPTNE
jgi:hypothetical protein